MSEAPHAHNAQDADDARHGVTPDALATLLDSVPDARILSLDCFDTLLWRDTHGPRDIFHALPGVAQQQRLWAEARARRAALVAHDRNEVSIAEIHAALLPNADAAQRARAVAGELALERRHCFAFAPVVALMLSARARGMRVAIVSDTYLSAEQLRTLIRDAAGETVAACIDHVFTSSDHGRSKSEGLFEDVLHATGAPARSVLHIGDNRAADVDAPRRLGIRARHLLQFSEESAQRLRLEAAAGALLHPGGIAFQPHRATLSLNETTLSDPAALLGHNVLGPVLVPFAHWILREIVRAEESGPPGGKAHCLFLMRDGFLPRAVFDTLFPGIGSAEAEISRFTAIGAGLTDADAARRFICDEIGNGSVEELLRQLHFGEAETTALLRDLPSSGGASATGRLLALARRLREDGTIHTITERAHAMADRLIAHVRRAIDPAPGDTVLLIDLGYNGTVQNHVATLLERRLGVHVAGRYLLLREQESSGLDKRGFLDARHYDADTLDALAANVAVVEQLCTAARGSTVGYAADGTPIRAGNGIKGRQNATRTTVQQGTLAYARADRSGEVRAHAPDRSAMERIGAAAVLARFLFLPQPEELAVLERFEHDINLGSKGTVPLFDRDLAEAGLRERGPFYLKSADRMFLPAELRGHGLSLSLALFAQRRFGLDLRYADFCDSTLELPILLANGNAVTQSTVRAVPTHDGHFLATVPVGKGAYTVGVQFGRAHEWVQIHSAEFVPVRGFASDKPSRAEDTRPARPSLEGMEQVAPFLFHCTDANGFLLVQPPEQCAEPMLLALSFRPLVARQPAAPAARACNLSQEQQDD